jgi:hypothetical protein
MEFDLVRAFRCPSFEHSQAKAGERANRSGLLRVFEDFGAGVVFLFHVYTLPQDGEKASIFFIFFYFFSLDTRPKPPSPFLKKFKRLFYF